MIQRLIHLLVLMLMVLNSSLAWTMMPKHHKQQPAAISNKAGNPTAAAAVATTAVAICCGWTILLTSSSAAAVAATDGSSSSGNIVRGQQVFENNCAACHVGGQNLINTPRTLKREAIEKNLGALDQTTIQNFVQNSVVHRGAFILGSKLSNKDFENVVSYVVDQATNDKWTTTTTTE